MRGIKTVSCLKVGGAACCVPVLYMGGGCGMPYLAKPDCHRVCVTCPLCTNYGHVMICDMKMKLDCVFWIASDEKYKDRICEM